jgi:uncharacterized protein involved in exopolysaccharide biosynthesis
MTANPAPPGLLRRLWTHKWLLVACMLVSLAGTSAALRFYPPRYRSQTVILVIPQRVPDEYVHSPGTEDVAKRLATIRQQVLSRPQLERIVLEFNLYKPEREQGIMDDIVQRMRNDIQLEMISSDSFRIGFSGTDPRSVQRVTERLASLFINGNLDERVRLADSTYQFIDGQLEDTRRRLTEKEVTLNDAARAGHPPTRADAIEYEVVQQEYRDLLIKQRSFEMAASLERQQIGEQFKLLDPARIPDAPFAPNHLKVNAAGAGAGLVLGIALIGFTTRRRERVVDSET